MSERGNMPTESWRPQRRASMIDAQGLRTALIAGGVLAVLGLGYGGYAMVNRAPRIVPVIEADSRPIRIRPDNPGGMQVAGAEEAIMGGEGSGQADAMAPPPEVPQPQVLRAQIEAARQPPPAPPPVPPPLAPAQPVSLAAPPAPPPPAISAAPEQRPVPVARAAPAHAAGPSVAGRTEVQLAAMDSEGAARAEWQRLAKRMPELLGARQPAVQRVDRDGKTLFRLRTGGFADNAEASSFCGQVKAKGGGCTVASF